MNATPSGSAITRSASRRCAGLRSACRRCSVATSSSKVTGGAPSGPWRAAVTPRPYPVCRRCASTPCIRDRRCKNPCIIARRVVNGGPVVAVAPSATLAINERVQARRAAGQQVLHLGFGEAGLPVLPSVARVLAEAAPLTGYPPVAGTRSARAAAAGWFARRGVATDPDQIVLAPGSKALLSAILTALPGDVVLPVPSWVSYAAQ